MQRAYNLPNLLLISIINDYPDDNKNDLKFVLEKDFEYMTNLRDKYNIRVHILKNFKENELITQLNNLNAIYKKRDDVDTIIIHYSGHGYYTDKNLIAGIYTPDIHLKKVSLGKILSIFESFDNLFCIFNACRTINDNGPINFDEIKNKYVCLLFASEKGLTAFADSHIGGYLTYSFYTSIIKKISPKKLTIFDILSIMINSIIMYKTVENDRTPKFYVNHNVRNEFGDIITDIRNLTEQTSKSIIVTKINNAALINQYENEIIKLKIKKQIKTAQNVIKHIDECNEELQQIINEKNDMSSKYLNHLKDINSGKWEKNSPEYNNAINLSEKYDKLYNKFNELINNDILP